MRDKGGDAREFQRLQQVYQLILKKRQAQDAEAANHRPGGALSLCPAVDAPFSSVNTALCFGFPLYRWMLSFVWFIQ